MKKIIAFLMILCLFFTITFYHYEADAFAYGSSQISKKTTCVYWTKTGKKYHKTKKCRGLKKAKKIYKGSVKKAKKLKLKKCKICF